MFSRYPVLWLVHMQTSLWCILHTVSYRCLLHRIVIAMLLHESDVECLFLRVPSPMDSFVWMLSPSRWQSLPKLTRCLPRPPMMPELRLIWLVSELLRLCAELCNEFILFESLSISLFAASSFANRLSSDDGSCSPLTLFMALCELLLLLFSVAALVLKVISSYSCAFTTESLLIFAGAAQTWKFIKLTRGWCMRLN